MGIEFTPEKLIDRDAEQEIFEKLLKHEDDARLLTICDAGGHGKSELLKRLQYNCIYRFNTPVSLIELQNLDSTSPFELISKIRGALRGDFSNLKFDGYDEFNNARRDQDSSKFGAYSGSVVGSVPAQGATIGGSGNIVAGVLVQNPQGPVNLPPIVWGPEKEESARQKCVDAFFEDLKQICREETVVILLDTWERCNTVLQKWVLDTLLRVHCFDLNRRPERLVLVLAGRTENFPDFQIRLDKRYQLLVRSIVSFGEWDENHVKDFLSLHGYERLANNDEDVKYLCQKIRKGMSLQYALQVVEEHLAKVS
ncbi:MAG: hypothetical protein L0226_11905 [Acidobacteria bacterium]|nr:hypothetical protein [Acidobacteriota bacterium]